MHWGQMKKRIKREKKEREALERSLEAIYIGCCSEGISFAALQDLILEEHFQMEERKGGLIEGA